MGPRFIHDNSIAVSVTEGKTGLSIGAGNASKVNGEYTREKFLGGIAEPIFTHNHRLSISTDWKNFINLCVDSNLIYSNTSIPINLNRVGIALNFYQFTSANNVTISTAWSNFVAYAASRITDAVLSNGLSIYVEGSKRFNATADANSCGLARADGSADPSNLQVSVELNGTVIAKCNGIDDTGSRFQLVSH